MVTAQPKVGCILRHDAEPMAPYWPQARPLSPNVTPDTMRLGYRLFLGRDVEEEFIEILCETYPTVDHFRDYLINMPEFRAKIGQVRKPSLSGHEPPIRVDGIRGEADLGPLFEHVRKTWQKFGETEPHWSVSTSDLFRQENLDENRALFYESGRSETDRFTRTLVRNGIDPAVLKTCVEIGCGVGRITGYLAARFEHVVGYDISSAHLALAREYLDQKGIGNVELRHMGGVEEMGRMPRCDAVFTVVVLQHNPPPIIKALVESMIRALNPGGVAYFQVPTYNESYGFDLDAYMANDLAGDETMEMHVLPQEAIFEIAAAEGARVVEVIEDTYTMGRPGELSNTLLIQKR